MELKTSKMPLQTITKYFFKAPGPNQNGPVRIHDSPGLSDDAKRTPTDLKPNSGGASRVTNMDMSDLPNALGPHSYLFDPLNEVGKRLNNERSRCAPARKRKLGKEKTNLEEETIASKKPRLIDFSFDSSEDEAKNDKHDRQTQHCKHCDYNDNNMERMRNHYKYRHPYIRCNDTYIQDASDQSSTFCCLECPAEFGSLANILKHYKGNHPEDLDVFTLHSFQHDVAFGCLVCPVSTSRMRALVKHYKNKHPRRKVDISLTHWRQFVRARQEEQPQLNTSGKAPGQDMSRGTSHESGSSPCKERESVSLADVALYNCNECTFSHKSVIVLFVHYQKFHPNEAVTIDKLKRSNQGSSYACLQKMPEMSINMVIEKSTHLKDNQDSSVETRSNAELFQQKKIPPSRKTEASKNSLETPKQTQKGKSAASGRKGRQPTAKHDDDDDMSAGKRSLSSTSPNDMFYCHFCTFSSSKIRRIINHHKTIHAEEELKDYTDIILYSEEVRKHKHGGGASRSTETIFDSTEREELPHEKEASDTSRKSYACTENLFYCENCNYGNVTVKGILRHMSTVHRNFKCDQDSVVKYTDLVHKDINKFGSQVKELPFTTNLPLPLLNKGDEDKFFCYFCNYRHRDIQSIYKHCYRKHHLSGTINHIYLYTAVVHKLASQHRTTSSQEAKRASMGEQGNSVTEAQQAPKRLQCPKCEYSTQQMYLFSRHMLKTHNCMNTDKDVSTVKQGIPHDSDKHSEVVHQHCQEEKSPALCLPEQIAPASGPSDSSTPVGHVNVHSLFKCPHCRLLFPTLNGYKTHHGKKHPDAEYKHLDEGQVGGKLQLFTCTHCPYANTKPHGLLTHCRMKHAHHMPNIEWHLQDLLDKWKGQGPDVTLSGFHCKTCLQLFSSMETLTRHCKDSHEEEEEEEEEEEIVANAGPGMTKALTVRKITHYMTKHKPEKLSKAFTLRRGMYATPKCQLCSYKCVSKAGLMKHMRSYHKNETVTAFLYKCVLCTDVFSKKKHLGSHYVMKHGNKAYMKYCVPLNKETDKQQASKSSARHDASKSSATAEGDKILVYKCPHCPYVHASCQGILTHSKMSHQYLRVKADELEKVEVLMTNEIGCPNEGTSSIRGYLCPKCQQVHASLNMLKNHHKKDHRAVLEVSTTDTVRHGQQVPTETSQASAPEEELLFKCTICNYIGYSRKCLDNHYYNTHKLDALTKKILLQKYNIYKKNPQNMSEADTEGHKAVSHRIGPSLQLDKVRLAHYSACHVKLDFAVLSKATDRSTGIYRCCHCQKRLCGIRSLSSHLDRHRALKKRAEKMKASPAKTSPTSPEVDSGSVSPQQELPMFATARELAQWCEAHVETSTVARNVSENGHSCNRCGQMCASLKLLRLHERAHVSLSAFRKHLTASALKHIDRFLSFRAGTWRPFTCNICPYRTTVRDLCRSHFIKAHPNLPEKDGKDEARAQTADSEPSRLSQNINILPELDEEPEITRESDLETEFPSVQLQLFQYSSMASAGDAAKTTANEVRFINTRAIQCEICDFNSEHISSLRRHYQNRHGKKILKCKDCEFFTGLRKTLEMHQKMGHYTFQSEPTYQKELPCPFCLYQSRNRNNMIDHIALHREERVVPIELCRPKLSRYLQGVVFRCHKCTFTSGSSENLRLHMTQHDDIRPYKCRLCYFDCARLSDLEAHLSDKHQVLRNHELVGLVNLDQLEARAQQEAEHLTQQNNCEDATVDDDTQDKNQLEIYTGENMTLEIKDSNLKQAQADEDEGSSASDSLCEGTTPNSAVQAQAEVAQSGDPACRPQTENMAKREFGDSNNTDNQEEDSNSPDRKKRTCESQNPPPKQEAAEGKSRSPFVQVGKLLCKVGKHGRMNVEAQVEDDLLCDIILLDEDTRTCKRRKKESRVASPDKTLAPNGNCKQPERSHKKILGDFNCKEWQGAKNNGEELRDADEGKKKPQDEDHHYHLKPEHEITNEEELTSCKLCGRRFTDNSDLKHHLMRHRI